MMSSYVKPWIPHACIIKSQLQYLINVIYGARLFYVIVWKAVVVQWWKHSPPTNVARVWFSDSASYVGWVCLFSSLLWEVFPRVLRFSPLLKNLHLNKFNLIYLICTRPHKLWALNLSFLNKRILILSYIWNELLMGPTWRSEKSELQMGFEPMTLR